MKSRNFQRGWLAALLIAPVVLFFLPADFFDEGIALCPSRLIFDIDCPGCGMTRAVMHLLHFDLDSALYFNRGVVIIFPALIYIWYLWTKDAADLSGFLPKKG